MAKFDDTGKVQDERTGRIGPFPPPIAGRKDALISRNLPFPERTAHFCMRAISALMLALVVWIALITLVREDQNADEVKIPALIFLFAAALTAVFFPRPVIVKALDWLRPRKQDLLSAGFALFALGLMARVGFMLFDYSPTSDPKIFFDNAMSISQTGMIKDISYITAFPFLYAYEALLAVVFNLTGSGVLGIIVLNTAFDALATYGVGHLVYLLTASRKWQMAASVFWWISPFNIIFCAISLPVIVVNALILAVLILLVHLFRNIENLKRTLVLSATASVTLALEDAFRPIAIITVIAIILYYPVCLMKVYNLKRLRNCVLSIAIIAGLSAASSHGWQQVVNSATGLPANVNKQGWSIYVGGNFETGGSWSSEDYNHMLSVLEAYNGDHSRAFGELQREGIQRWKQLGPVKAMALVVKKSVILAGNNQNMIYNLPGSYPYWRKHVPQFQAMVVLCAIYWFLMLAFAVRLFFRRRRVKELDFLGFLSILTIGLFLASMVVEVANRYFTVFFPMFTVFAMLGLKSALEGLRSAPPHGLGTRRLRKRITG